MSALPPWRRAAALTLAVTLAVTLASLGIPGAVSASGEPEQSATRTAAITIRGQTLGQFLSTTVRPEGGLSFTAFTRREQGQPSDGQISGVALSRRGRPLRGHRVELRLPDPNRPGALGVLFYFAIPREDATIPDELDVSAGAPPLR